MPNFFIHKHLPYYQPNFHRIFSKNCTTHTPMAHILLIINPKAGAGKIDSPLSEAKARLEALGLTHQIFQTTPYCFADGSLAHALQAPDLHQILILGGDGTVNEVVNALNGRDLPIGIIPTGTGNDFLRNLGLHRKVADQVASALLGEVITVDTGRCNDRIFLNGVGVGFDGKVVEHQHRKGKKSGGEMAYLLTVLQILWNYRAPSIRFRADQAATDGEVFMLTIANGTTFGGFVLAPDARLDDGQLDVCFIPRLGQLERFLAVPVFQKGQQFERKMAFHYMAQQVNVAETAHAVAHLDGEFIGHPPFNITISPRSLRVKRSPNLT